MSKVQLVVSDRYRVAIPVEYLKENRVGSLFRSLKLFALLLSGILVAILPVVSVLSAYSVSELDQFKLLVLLAATLAIILLVLVWLGGKKQLIDPPGFLGVLVFAFLSISALLLVSLIGGSSSSTSFGNEGVRYLSSIALMSFGLLYYIVIFLSDRFWKLKYLYLSLIAVSVIAILLSALNLRYLQELAPVIAITLPIFAVIAVFSSKLGARVISVFLGLLGAVLLLQPLSDSVIQTLPAYSTWSSSRLAFTEQWVALLFVPVISLLVLSLMVLRQNEWRVALPWQVVASKYKKYRAKDISASELLVAILPQILLLLAILWLVLSVIFAIANGGDMVDLVNRVSLGYKKGLSGDLLSILLGHGFTTTIIESYWANVLYVQGLVGIGAHLILTGTAFLLLSELVKMEVKNIKHMRLSYFLAPVVLGVPILGIFLNVSIVLVVLWWFALAILSANLFLRRRNVYVHLWEELHIWRIKLSRKLTLVRLLGILFIFVCGYFVVSQLWVIIK